MKIMLIGASGAGKTTLIQRLQDLELKYDKTQNRWFWGPLTVTSYDADIVGFVHDSTNEDCWFNGGLRSKFERPVIGIVTKVDQPDANPSRSRNYLEFAGVTDIYETSAYDGSGIEALSEGFHRILEKK